MTNAALQESKTMSMTLELEEYIIGQMLGAWHEPDFNEIADFLQKLSPKDFTGDKTRAAFTAIKQLFEQKAPIDPIIISRVTEGKVSVVELFGYKKGISTTANYDFYIEQLKEDVRKKKIKDLAKTITYRIEEDDSETVLTEIQQELIKLADTNKRRNQCVPVGTLLDELLKESDTEMQGLNPRVLWGFPDLEAIIGGHERGTVTLIAGRAKMGKSTFMYTQVIQMCKWAVEHDEVVLMFTLEIPTKRLLKLLACMIAEINYKDLLRHKRPADYAKFVKALAEVTQWPLYIDESKVSPAGIRIKTNQIQSITGKKISGLFVDYLQLMRPDGRHQSREREIASISGDLVDIAKMYDTTVIAASQLNRKAEDRTDHRPSLADLRESGCLTGDTLIKNAYTGQLYRMDELVNNLEPIPVFAIDENFNLVIKPMIKVFYSGKKKVYELKTQSGRKIKASGNHKFRKLNGWYSLDTLNKDDYIALPRIFEMESNIMSNKVYWDRIISITELEESDVYDATVEDVHNFIANDIVVHNSLENDLHLALLIYRDEYYHPKSKDAGIANIIIAANRGGDTGMVDLHWDRSVPTYRSLKHVF